MPGLLDGPDKDVPAIRRQFRTPRAGLRRARVLGSPVAALVLVRVAIRATPSDAGVWLTEQTHRHAVLAALGLMPFAAIAFLWFIGLVRDHIGDQEDRFFATVFVSSGVLFLAMMLAAAALAGSLVDSAHQNSELAASGTWDVARHASDTLIYDYAMRMAAVFMISTSTLLSRGGLAPRLLARPAMRSQRCC